MANARHEKLASFDSERTQSTQGSQKKQTTAKRALHKIGEHWKEHHRSVNAAYKTYYGGGN